MQLKELKKIFHRELSAQYGKNEIDSVFYLCLEHYFKLPRFILALQPNYTLEKDEAAIFFSALNRLKMNEPVQYILGETDFMGRVFKVDKNVLIPRPETGELVQWVIEDVQNGNPATRLLDIGTGSGIIAVTLALELPGLAVDAIDISEKALEVAQYNADSLGAVIRFFNADIRSEGVINGEPFASRTYDIIVSNPPYVRTSEKKRMAPNVTSWEPDAALYVPDNDPLVYYRDIARVARKGLRNGGVLYLEINQYLYGELKTLLEEEKFSEIELRKDIHGNFRMLKGTFVAK